MSRGNPVVNLGSPALVGGGQVAGQLSGRCIKDRESSQVVTMVELAESRLKVRTCALGG